MQVIMSRLVYVARATAPANGGRALETRHVILMQGSCQSTRRVAFVSDLILRSRFATGHVPTIVQVVIDR